MLSEKYVRIPVGIHSVGFIRINVKGHGNKLPEKICVSDSYIDYNAPDVIFLLQPDKRIYFFVRLIIESTWLL